MRKLSLLLLICVFSFSEVGLSRQEPLHGSKKAGFSKKHGRNKRSDALHFFASRHKTRWALMLQIKKQTKAHRFAELKSLGDKLKINYKKKVNFERLKKITQVHKNLKFNPAKPLRQQFNIIKNRISAKKAFNPLFYFFFEPAYAKKALLDTVSPEESIGYDTLLLIYYQYLARENTKESHPNADVEDFSFAAKEAFLNEEIVQRIAKKRGNQNLKVSIECNKNGMIFVFNDGTKDIKKSEVSWKYSFLDEQEVYQMSEEKMGTSKKSQQKVDLTNSNPEEVDIAWNYYCIELNAINNKIKTFDYDRDLLEQPGGSPDVSR